MKKLIQELIVRWKSESPSFWKKIMKISLTLGGSALGIIAINSQYDLVSLGVSPVILTACGYILTWCGALGLAAKLTMKPNDNN